MTAGRGDISLCNLQRHFYIFSLLVAYFSLVKVMFEIMHPEFAMVFLSRISCVRLSNRYAF